MINNINEINCIKKNSLYYNNEDKKQSIKKNYIDRLYNYNYVCTVFRTNEFTIKLLMSKHNNNDKILLKEFKKEFINQNSKYSNNNKIEIYKNEVELLFNLKGFDLIPCIKFPYHNKYNLCIAYTNYSNFLISFDDFYYLDKDLNNEIVKFYLANFIHLFEHLLSKSILYRGFSYKDIFIRKNGYILCNNIDKCLRIDNTKKNMCYTLINPPEYLAPEMLNYTGYDYRSNYFLIGIILYELIHGYNPFVDKDPILTYKNILGCKYKNINADRSSTILIKSLLVKDTSLRLGCGKNGINDITYNKYFLNFNWSEFSKRTMICPIDVYEIQNKILSNIKGCNYAEEYYSKYYNNSPNMKNILKLKDNKSKDNNYNDILGVLDEDDYVNGYNNNDNIFKLMDYFDSRYKYV